MTAFDTSEADVDALAGSIAAAAPAHRRDRPTAASWATRRS
jgi:hypothetical protein